MGNALIAFGAILSILGPFGLSLGVPGAMFAALLVPVEPILTFKTDFSSFDNVALGGDYAKRRPWDTNLS